MGRKQVRYPFPLSKLGPRIVELHARPTVRGAKFAVRFLYIACEIPGIAEAPGSVCAGPKSCESVPFRLAGVDQPPV